MDLEDQDKRENSEIDSSDKKNLGEGVYKKDGRVYIRPTSHDEMTVPECAEFLGRPLSTIHNRIRYGWTADQIFGLTKRSHLKSSENSSQDGEKRRHRERYEYLGQEYSLSKLAEAVGVSRRTMHHRIVKVGWNVEEAVETIPFTRQGKRSRGRRA